MSNRICLSLGAVQVASSRPFSPLFEGRNYCPIP
jgi:hypothetical protein